MVARNDSHHSYPSSRWFYVRKTAFTASRRTFPKHFKAVTSDRLRWKVQRVYLRPFGRGRNLARASCGLHITHLSDLPGASAAEEVGSGMTKREKMVEITIPPDPDADLDLQFFGGVVKLAGTQAEAVRRIAEGTQVAVGIGADIARLALLTPVQYDRVRDYEAKKLDVRVSTLDTEVQRIRQAGSTTTDTGNGASVLFDDLEPWPDLVAGATILNEVAAAILRYIVTAKEAATAATLWIASAHAFNCFLHSPRLNITAPERGCGKTAFLDVVAALTPRALRVENITTAALFRIIEKHTPTLLIDEYDSFLKDNEELRGALNAGHKRGGVIPRCEGDKNEVRLYKTFAPVALAGIRGLPGTLHDRSIIIRLTRAKKEELRARFDSRKTQNEKILQRKLARWTADNAAALEACDPVLPEAAFNRIADNWRPLFAVAEIAGGGWPQRAAEAFRVLTVDTDGNEGAAVQLLADLRTIFDSAGVDRIASAALCDCLAGMDESPWSEWHHEKPITTRQLSRLLNTFRIAPGTIRLNEEATAKGYYRAAFDDAFDRYLPKRSVTTTQPYKTSRFRENRSDTRPEGVTDQSREKPLKNKSCVVVADRNPPTPEAWEDEL